MTRETRTEAGRKLLEWLRWARSRGFAGIPTADAILAIEDEARVPLKVAARAVVDEFSFWVSDGMERVGWPVDSDGLAYRDADAKVLRLRAALEEES